MYRVFFSQLNKLKPLAFLLTLSLLSTPFQLRAQSHCYQPCEEEVNCCQDNGNFQNKALIIGGAAIVGGVIGAMIGNSDHHHSSSGSRGHSGSSGEPGPTGPTGPVGPPGAGFTNDPGQTLTFNLSVVIVGLPQIIDDGQHFSGTLIPFVTGPDGNTFGNTPVVLTDIPLYHEEFFAPIVIDNPVFGTYQAGVQIAGENSYSFQSTLYGDVIASRNGSTTNLLVNNFEIPEAGQQVQAELLFSYDQQNIP